MSWKLPVWCQVMCAMAVPRPKFGSGGLKGFLRQKLFLVAAAALLAPNTCSAAASGEWVVKLDPRFEAGGAKRPKKCRNTEKSMSVIKCESIFNFRSDRLLLFCKISIPFLLSLVQPATYSCNQGLNAQKNVGQSKTCKVAWNSLSQYILVIHENKEYNRE